MALLLPGTMDTRQALAFLLFAAAAAGTPGPSNLLLTATGARVGLLRGLPALLGVTVGMGAMLSVVTLGLGSVVLAHPTLLQALRAVAAMFLLWLAWKIATSRGGADAVARPIGFAGGAAFQWVNPKSWLVCASAAGTYLDAASGGAVEQAVTLGALFTAAALPCCLPWLAFGATAQRFLRNERSRRTFNVAMGLLLALSVVLVIR